MNPQQRLESPEPYEDSPANAGRPSSQPSQRIASGRRSKGNVTTMEDRLQQMPEKRALPWREGVEEGADIETGGDSRRKQIRYGCLLATRGEVQTPGCISCENGRGKFSLCIALDGYFKGACASCQLSGRPNRCSIKKEDDAIPSPTTNTPNGDVSFNNDQQTTPSGAPSSSGPPKKRRRRTSEVKRANEVKRPSPIEAPESAQPPSSQPPPRWRQESGPHARQEANEPPQRSWATVNQPIPRPPPPQSNGSNGNGHLQQNHYLASTTGGWATVNRPQPQAQLHYQSPPYPQPQLQTQSPVQQPMYNGGERNGNGLRRNTAEQERRESTIGNEEGSGALIDSLPKNKQRQVYGLVSGLQGGIEHLQRELDSLKRALGIDDEN